MTNLNYLGLIFKRQSDQSSTIKFKMKLPHGGNEEKAAGELLGPIKQKFIHDVKEVFMQCTYFFLWELSSVTESFLSIILCLLHKHLRINGLHRLVGGSPGQSLLHFDLQEKIKPAKMKHLSSWISPSILRCVYI